MDSTKWAEMSSVVCAIRDMATKGRDSIEDTLSMSLGSDSEKMFKWKMLVDVMVDLLHKMNEYAKSSGTTLQHVHPLGGETIESLFARIHCAAVRLLQLRNTGCSHEALVDELAHELYTAVHKNLLKWEATLHTLHETKTAITRQDTFMHLECKCRPISDESRAGVHALAEKVRHDCQLEKQEREQEREHEREHERERECEQEMRREMRRDAEQQARRKAEDKRRESARKELRNLMMQLCDELETEEQIQELSVKMQRAIDRVQSRKRQRDDD